jgi:hypothetical protein
MNTILLEHINNIISTDYFWLVFNVVCFVVYLVGLLVCFKRDRNGCSCPHKVFLAGCGVVLFSYAFHSLAYFIADRNRPLFSLDNQEEISNYSVLILDLSESIRCCGFILIAAGIYVRQSDAPKDFQ